LCAIVVSSKFTRSDDVDFGIEERLTNRTANIHLCRVMIHNFGMKFTKDLLQEGPITNVTLEELRIPIQIVAAASGEIINDSNLVPERNICVRDVGSDEARAAGY
jgi:hypothetical protein